MNFIFGNMIPIFLALVVHSVQIFGQSIGKITRVVNYADAADLSCSYGHYVTEIKSNYDRKQKKRNIRVSCRRLPQGVAITECQETSFSDVNAEYAQLGCGADYFVTGLKFGYWPDYRNENSIAVKLECCRSYRIKFVKCGVGISSQPRMPFEKWLSRNDTVFRTLNTWKSGNDRAFQFDLCIFRILQTTFNRAPAPFATTPLPLRPTVVPSQFFYPLTVAPSWSNNNNNKVSGEDEDFEIFILEKEVATTTKLPPKLNNLAMDVYQAQTTPFRDFDIRCPAKSAIRSIFLKKVQTSNTADLIFALKCGRIPYYLEEPDHHFVERLDFSTAEDGSLQSPCNPQRGLFLCGLQGTYDQIRKLRAHCCFVTYLKINLSRTPVAQVPTVNGVELLSPTAASNELQFVSNIDRLKDGSFVAQIMTFASNYRS